MKKKTHIPVVAIVLALSCIQPGTVWAAGPVADRENSGYDEETWSRLMDDVLEYDEISLLVHECNSSILETWGDLETAKQNILDSVEELQSQKRKMENLRDAAKNDKDDTEQEAYANYVGQVKTLEGTISSMTSGLSSINSKSTLTSIQRGEDQITQTAQSLLISYDTLRQQKSTMEHLQTLYSEQYQLAVNKRAQGMATDTDVLTAQTNLLSAQSNILEVESGMLKLKPTILSLTGWAADADPKIAAIPAVDLTLIDSMDLEADTVKAIGNNTTMMELRRSEEGKTNAGVAARLAKIEEGEQKVTIELKALYDDVAIKKAAYESALTGYQSAQTSQAGNDRRYALGMLGKSDYLATQVSFYQKEAAYETADTALRLSIETYRWAVRGFLTIDE